MFKPNYLKEAIEHYGLETQQKKLSEEVLELQLAVNELAAAQRSRKHINTTKLKEHVAEEMADVLNLVEQIRLHCRVSMGHVNNFREFKATRQHYRVLEEKADEQ